MIIPRTPSPEPEVEFITQVVVPPSRRAARDLADEFTLDELEELVRERRSRKKVYFDCCDSMV
jgi:hypothetical protein